MTRTKVCKSAQAMDEFFAVLDQLFAERRNEPVMTLSRTATFWVVVTAYLTLMISASTPSPLYVVYQDGMALPDLDADGRVRRLRRRAACSRC